MAHSNPFMDRRILSQSMKVYWAGWETTTTRLQQEGWELSAEQDILNGSLRVAMRHQQLQVTAITNPMPFEYFEHSYHRSLPPLHVQYLANRLVVHIYDNLSAFKPIDAMPQMVTSEMKEIEDFGIFATPLVRTEEIIVEPQDVQSLLDQIKKLQAPDQAAIRAKQRLRENRQGTHFEARPQQKFHAQILSITA